MSINRWLILICSLGVPIMCGFWAVHLGQDVNWDFRNYHVYNAYSFLNDRSNLDLAPAQLQSFLNPILDFPFYGLMQCCSAKSVGFVLGVIHGINLVFVLRIFLHLTKQSTVTVRWVGGLIAVLFGAWSPSFVGELGGTMNDNLVSLFVLSALLLLIKYADSESKGTSARSLLAFAGTILGLGVGLKLTVAAFAIGAATALFFVRGPWMDRFLSILLFGISGLVGTAISGGYWFWEMWSNYQNPLFPFYNNIFQSEWLEARILQDRRFLPADFGAFIIWPIIFSLNPLRVIEVPFTDYRFLVIYVLFTALTLRGMAVRLWFRGSSLDVTSSSNLLLVFFAISFISWAYLFSIYRYLMPLELLAGPVILILLERLIPTVGVRASAFLGIVICLSLLMQPFAYGRVAWGESYIEIQTEWDLQADFQDSLVVMAGDSPMAYIIPSFPASTKFVRIDGNLHLRPNEQLSLKGKGLVSDHLAHKKPLFVLRHLTERLGGVQSLKRVGVNAEIGECKSLRVNRHDVMELCRVN